MRLSICLFFIEDGGLLEAYNNIWEKTSNLMKKGFDSEPVHDEKCLKSKTKSYDSKIKTNFCGNKMPKDGTHCVCLSMILIDSVVKMDKNYYPQIFLEECK